jgi:hypothetical protein
MKLITSPDPIVHSLNIQSALKEVIDHLEFDINLVNEPRFQALVETSREVLKGLHKTFDDYERGTGKAWGGGGAEAKKVTPHE